MTTPNVNHFQFEGSQISYRTFGSGPNILLAFHGFGQTGQVFTSVDNYLTDYYTIFAIDLFFHGTSHYDSGNPLSKADWYQLITAFLASNNINRFSLIGFSLGGRFALVTVEALAHRVDQLILIAPDAITRNVWYQLATSTKAGRSLFRYVLHHLPVLYWFGNAFARFGLLNRSVLRFAEISLKSVGQRRQVYQSWTLFRQLQPNLRSISNAVNGTTVRVRFFIGAFDRLIRGAYILPLTRKLQNYELTVLRTGHNHLIELTTQELSKQR